MDFNYNEGHSQVYICNVNQNQTPILQEGLAMEWMTLEEIARIKLGFEQEPIVNELYKELQNKT